MFISQYTGWFRRTTCWTRYLAKPMLINTLWCIRIFHFTVLPARRKYLAKSTPNIILASPSAWSSKEQSITRFHYCLYSRRRYDIAFAFFECLCRENKPSEVLPIYITPKRLCERQKSEAMCCIYILCIQHTLRARLSQKMLRALEILLDNIFQIT